MNFALYGLACRQADDQILQQKIEVNAEHQFCFYSAYGHFLSELRATQTERFKISQSDRLMPVEHLVRVRRCVAFSDASALQPQKDITDEVIDVLKLLRKLCNLDHVSVWRSSLGTMFILDEPYGKLEIFSGDLLKHGFVYIELPISLSPYCGGWTNLVGALPCSTSYLICNHDSNDELLDIQCKIQTAASISPRWNDTVGVSYV